MNKKISVLFLVFFLISSHSAIAQDSGRYLVFDIGQSSSNMARGHSEFDVYRMGVQKEFKRTFWQGDSAQLSGYWEGSFNYWNADGGNEYALALSPVFVLSFGEGEYRPFVEAGVGLAIMSDDVIGGRRMGSSWQFEDRIGFGVKSDRVGFHYRYMHYSNGDIEKPNQGIDAHVIGMTYHF